MKIFQNYTKVSENNLNPVYTALQLLLSILLLTWLACSKPTDPPEPTPITVATLTTATIITIAETTAQSGGNITADGGSAITARGVIWSTTASPTIADSKTIDGTGKGNFTSSITGLTANTTYYARAYATNNAGTGYGNEVSFTTAEVVVMPVLTTTDVTVITTTTAKSGGNITVGGTISARGICWSTTANPTVADSKTNDGTGKGNFTSSITGLTANTTYYARAYATNSIGTAYGNEVSFTTEEESLLIGKWNVESSNYKLYVNSQLVEDHYALVNADDTWDFQPNGIVVISDDGVIKSYPYTIFPDSTLQVGEEVTEIRNLTDSSVIFYQRGDRSPDEYYEYIISLKK